MATSVSQELYPFSTSDSKAIPLDVIMPNSCLMQAVAQNAATAIDLSGVDELVFIYASTAVLIDFGNAATYPLTSGVEYASALFIPAEGTMTIRLPSLTAAKVVPLLANTSGTLVIQSIQKWAAIGLQRQLSTR